MDLLLIFLTVRARSRGETDESFLPILLGFIKSVFWGLYDGVRVLGC